MKRCIFLFYIFVLHLGSSQMKALKIVTTVNIAKLIYRRAQLEDLASIQQLYKTVNVEDRKKLLLFPESFQEAILINSLRKNRLFIAIDPCKPVTRQATNIVSILKIFVLGAYEAHANEDEETLNLAATEAEDEKMAILCKELRAVSWNRRPIISINQKGFYTYPYTFTYQPDREPLFKRDNRINFNHSDKQTYVYYGSAYTAPSCRGQGVSTQLERFALEEIKDEILVDIVNRRSKRLFYIYGVVRSGASSKGRIRVFSAFVQYIKSELMLPLDTHDPVKLRFFMFDTFKPDFITRGNRLIQRPDKEENAGYGCFIESSLEGAVYPEKQG
jgi:GNAT superfamily N-acetyltransferase